MDSSTTTREIPLTKGRVATVDASDYEALAGFSWYALHRSNKWHAARTHKREGVKRTVYMHRQILGGPPGLEVDHENGDGLNNRRGNLRAATKRQNGQNRRQQSGTKSSRFHGVAWHGYSDRWRVVICGGPLNDKGHAKQLYIGVYRDEEEAARAYDRAAIKHFGQFALTNFPRENYK